MKNDSTNSYPQANRSNSHLLQTAAPKPISAPLDGKLIAIGFEMLWQCKGLTFRLRPDGSFWAEPYGYILALLFLQVYTQSVTNVPSIQTQPTTSTVTANQRIIAQTYQTSSHSTIWGQSISVPLLGLWCSRKWYDRHPCKLRDFVQVSTC